MAQLNSLGVLGNASIASDLKITGEVDFTENTNSINFRPNNSNYCTHVSYQTAGNEALVFGTTNAVTSFIFVNGENMSNIGSSRWQSISDPGLQIKNNCVSIGALIGNNTAPSYKLTVNGGSAFKGKIVLDSNSYGTLALTSDSQPSNPVVGQIYFKLIT